MARRQLLAKEQALPQEPTINVTPLIDVVFVLLIAFIVVAPLVELDRIELASSDGLTSHIPLHLEDASPIQIHVHENNSVQFNGQIVRISELTNLLRGAKARYPQARAQLFHHKNAFFGTYQAVKNALEAAEFKEMDVVLLPS
jgi:biopolymer transport protein ExbD